MKIPSFSHLLAAITITLFCLIPSKAEAITQDTVSERLMEDIRKYFNMEDEQAFYKSTARYRDYMLEKNNLPNYYQGWTNEILYDVNHNHFYRAMRKTTFIQKDMQRRKADKQLYKATRMRGLIYSLRGNLSLAQKYYEKAIDQVDHSQPGNLFGLYMDLANIEMDTQPQEAMKNLDCAIEIIKAYDSEYEYSDAVCLKVIVAYAMRDWETVNKLFQEYMQLKEKFGKNFSTTYYNYVKICKFVADKHYDDAIQMAYQLTNTTDTYKFLTEIYELSGDIHRAYDMQKKYMAVKDSVNNVIMSEEMVGSANDLQNAELANEAFVNHNKKVRWSLYVIIISVLIFSYIACRLRKRKYMKKLQQQNRELIIARDKAEEAERMKINFLQNMSHEIRTPLNIISGYAQIISDPKTLMSENERAGMANRIMSSTRNIVRIIDEILDISSKESIHFVDKNDLIYCNKFAAELLEPYKMSKKDIEVIFKSELKDNFKILSNKGEVKKILNHLLDNAMKFTERGSITLKCQLDEVENMVCFSVADTGRGIRNGEEEKIFEHFYKIDAYKEGVGLGLPLSRRVARQLGGDVVIDLSYSDGSCFILKLPRE